MAAWIIYFRERFPLNTYLILCLGFAVSGALLGSPSYPHLENGISLFTELSVSTLGLLLFFGELRLMDELKDYAKDLVAHPDRPLPRKVLTLSQVQSTISAVFLFMLFFGGMVAVFSSFTAGALYLSFTFYLWLMFKEFYVGEALSRSPLLYAITHQIVLIPLCLFTVAIVSPDLTWSSEAVAYSITVLGAFFGYEVCRKLDPRSHPILKTYLSLYGSTKTSFLVLILLGVAAFGAKGFNAQFFLWPVEIVLATSLILIVFRPGQFKWVEGLATLSLVFHIWAVPIQQFLRKL